MNGLHFRRQQIVDGYFADFYCPQHELIVELDGSIHEFQKDHDAERPAHLITRGFRIIHFTNEEIIESLPVVLKRIVEACSLSIDEGIGQEHRDD